MITISSKIKFIESVFGASRLSANEKNIDVWCPKCAPLNREKKKLSIRIDDWRCHCWVCGFNGGSLITLLRLYSTPEKLNEYVETFKPELKNRLKTNLEFEQQKFKLPGDFKLLAINHGSKDPDVRAILNYVKARGVTQRDEWYYRIGTSNEFQWRRRVIFPSFDHEGNPNYAVARAIDANSFPKYYVPSIDKRSIIFNDVNIDWSKRIVLCEGVFDALRCGDNVIPILGSTLHHDSVLFEKIIVNNVPISLALDDDMIDTNTPMLVKKFTEYGIDVNVIDVSALGKHDPAEMSSAEFNVALADAKHMSWNDHLMSRLRSKMKISLSIDTTI